MKTVQCAKSRTGYFALRLYNAMKGLGTNEYVDFVLLMSLLTTFSNLLLLP